MTPMHYELYIDSLFFINFIMNLCLLALVDRNTFQSAGLMRIMAGAALGALCFFIPFVSRLPIPLKLAMGAGGGAAGMICVAFPVRSLRMFLKLLEKLLIYSFGLGGTVLFVIQRFPSARNALTSMFGVLGAGVFGYLLFCRLKTRAGAESLCRARLSRKDVRITVDALVDSGNSLIEPISGKPVCIVGQEVFAALWKGEEEEMGFRAIPYHSIGKKKGILRGYLLPELKLEMEDGEQIFQNVYIAVSKEEISGSEDAGAPSVKMIIHPGLFAKRRESRR